MPLYEYKCTNCGRHTEKRQKFSDPELTECPFCAGRLERVLSAPAISFKGGGWYADGYASAKPSSSSSSNSSDSSSGPSSSSSSNSPASSSGDSKSVPAASSPAPAASTSSSSSSSS